MARPRLVSGLGAALVLACFGFLVRALVRGYDDVRPAIIGASWGWLGVALVLSAAAMVALAVLWMACLRSVGASRRATEVVVWYFAGELGKYLPGGVWTLVGRGEVAARQGVDRATAYLSVVVALSVTIVAGVLAASVLSPALADEAPWVVWLAAPVGALALVALHPRCIAPTAALVRRVTRGRVDLVPLPWAAMVRLALAAVPAWATVGLASWAVAAALHLDSSPDRVAFAAIAAWIVGLAAVPVPAGAGVRELVFVQASGLDAGPAVLLATTARMLYVLVDGVGGALALRVLRSRSGGVDSGSVSISHP